MKLTYKPKKSCTQCRGKGWFEYVWFNIFTGVADTYVTQCFVCRLPPKESK